VPKFRSGGQPGFVALTSLQGCAVVINTVTDRRWPTAFHSLCRISVHKELTEMQVHQWKTVRPSCLQEGSLSCHACIHSFRRIDSSTSSHISCGNSDEVASAALQVDLAATYGTVTNNNWKAKPSLRRKCKIRAGTELPITTYHKKIHFPKCTYYQETRAQQYRIVSYREGAGLLSAP